MNRAGYVYLVKAEGPLDSYYKIGRSKHVPTRIRNIRLQLPFPVKLAHFEPTPNMFLAEAFLHDNFDYCRVNGEWFQLGDEEIEAFYAFCKDIVPNPRACEVFTTRQYTGKEHRLLLQFSEREDHIDWDSFLLQSDISRTRWEKRLLESQGPSKEP